MALLMQIYSFLVLFIPRALCTFSPIYDPPFIRSVKCPDLEVLTWERGVGNGMTTGVFKGFDIFWLPGRIFDYGLLNDSFQYVTDRGHI